MGGLHDHVEFLYGEGTADGTRDFLRRMQSARTLGQHYADAAFLDLGSGRGLVAMVAFMHFKFGSVVGVEAGNNRFAVACKVLEKLKAMLSKPEHKAFKQQLRGGQSRTLTFYHCTFGKFAKEAVLGNHDQRRTMVWTALYDQNALNDASEVWRMLPESSVVATLGSMPQQDMQALGYSYLKDEKSPMSWNPTGTVIHMWSKSAPRKSTVLSDLELLNNDVHDLEQMEKQESGVATPGLQSCSLTL